MNPCKCGGTPEKHQEEHKAGYVCNACGAAIMADRNPLILVSFGGGVVRRITDHGLFKTAEIAWNAQNS